MIRYEAHHNHGQGWEVSDMKATPIRTFVVGLTEEQARRIVAELNTPPSRRKHPISRKIFPRTGIYQFIGGLPSSHFMEPEHEKRYRFVKPAYPEMDLEQARQCWMADCWIVDRHGNTNPGTEICPVPVRLSSIGRRIS